LRKWIKSHIDEIISDRVLRLFGVALALTHILTVIFWSKTGMPQSLSKESVPICWPGLDFCPYLHVFSSAHIEIILYVYGILSLLVGMSFLFRSSSKLAVAGLFVITGAKFLIMSIDIRTAMNAHPVIFLVSFIFFFVPHKRFSIKLAIILIYFAAGIIKLDHHWISGENFGRMPGFLDFIPNQFAAIYVLILELLFSPLLLARNKLLKNFALGQFVLFQTASFAFIGFFFPTVMFCLLSLFVADQIFVEAAKDSEKNRIPFEYPPTAFSCSLMVYVFMFTLLQLMPKLISSEPIFSGEGKYFSLHMFETPIRCDAKVTLIDGSNKRTEFSFFPDLRTVNPRLSCNPLSYFWRAKAVCEAHTYESSEFLDFDLEVEVRLAAESNLKPLVSIKNFCSQQIEYRYRSNTPLDSGFQGRHSLCFGHDR